MLNQLLQEQLNAHIGTEVPKEFDLLFKKISDTYACLQKGDTLKENNCFSQYPGNVTSEKTGEDRRNLRLTTHLKFSQTTAAIGSYEADLSDGGHTNAYWTDEVFKILGYEPGEIIATFRSFFNAIHPEDRVWIMGKLENLIRRGGSFEIEHRIVTKDGAEKIVLNTVEVFVDEHTKVPFKFMGAVQDITEKRKKDRDVIQLNYELKTLFENMQEAFFSVDMTTYTMLQMSRACEKIYGYFPEEFLQDANLWLDVVLEEDKPIITGNYASIDAGNSINQQYRIFHKDGTIRWVETRVNPTLENGKLVRLDGVTSDITKRKESEIALQENELKFRTLIENCSDGIAVLNGKLELDFVSNSMGRLSGFPLEEMRGRYIFDLLHPDEIEWAQNLAKQLIDHPGTPFSLKGRFLKKDAGYFYYEGYITNLTHDPIIGGIICNFHDVTERQKAEEALKASNAELKKTNKELDRFVYSVSHDLRAPLASILGALEYAETETDEPVMLKNLSLMKGSAQRLDGFIVDILDYSRNSRLDIKKELVNFSELLQEVKNNLKYMGSKNADIDIRVNLRNSLPFYSDSSRLSIIINNLVSNSIRYYNPAVANPYVEVNVDADPKGAKLVIKDNGVGIDKKFHDKIFNMFYRLSKKSEGSGLGLYIVKETIEKLEGSLHLESVPGEGTTFTINVPNNN